MPGSPNRRVPIGSDEPSRVPPPSTSIASHASSLTPRSSYLSISFAVIGELLDPLDLDIASCRRGFWDAVDRDAFDVVLVHQQLDDCDPCALIQQWRNRGARKPAIAWADSHDNNRRLLNAGANSHIDLTKPMVPKAAIAAASALPERAAVNQPTAEHLAQVLGTSLALPSECIEQVATTLAQALFGKDAAWAAFQSGHTTHTALRNTLLGHASRIFHFPLQRTAQTNAAVRDFELALFPR